jgi:hypothetical protein
MLKCRDFLNLGKPFFLQIQNRTMKYLLALSLFVGATSFVVPTRLASRVVVPASETIFSSTSVTENRPFGLFSVAEAPVRTPETSERVDAVRKRYFDASIDAQNAKVSLENGFRPRESELKSFKAPSLNLSVPPYSLQGCAVDTGDEWWRDESAVNIPGGRPITSSDPLRVIVAGGGVAGLVAAAACHSQGMKVAIFEQASQYAPYGGPIQIQSNALRAMEQVRRTI